MLFAGGSSLKYYSCNVVRACITLTCQAIASGNHAPFQSLKFPITVTRTTVCRGRDSHIALAGVQSIWSDQHHGLFYDPNVEAKLISHRLPRNRAMSHECFMGVCIMWWLFVGVLEVKQITVIILLCIQSELPLNKSWKCQLMNPLIPFQPTPVLFFIIFSISSLNWNA